MSEEIEVKHYDIALCDLCYAGKGGECHTPGCALWCKSAPDVPLRGPMCVPIEPSNLEQALQDVLGKSLEITAAANEDAARYRALRRLVLHDGYVELQRINAEDAGDAPEPWYSVFSPGAADFEADTFDEAVDALREKTHGC